MASRWSAWTPPAAEADWDPGVAPEVTRTGTLVRVDGRPFARGASEASARAIESLIASAGGSENEVWLAGTAEQLARDTDVASFSERSDSLARATRGLRWVLNVYALGLLVLLPIAVAAVGSERALSLAFPAVLFWHLVCLLALARSDRAVRPGALGERVQLLFEAFVYPPQLLRAYHRVEAEALGRVHPAVLAALLLAGDARQAALRSEILAARGADGVLAPLELRALEQLTRELGEPIEGLLAGPTRQDPWAVGFCPSCHTEYRAPAETCADCSQPLERYPE
ncbi:MAG: hypothetical protein AAF430_22115 [Myxococcota bacterium]